MMTKEEFSTSSDDTSELNLKGLEKTLGNIVNANNGANSSREETVERISRLLDETRSIAYTPQRSPSHRVAACNVLCGVVDLCMESAQKEIRDLVSNNDFLEALLDVYLDRYDISKGKSMKRLLGTLLKIFKGLKKADHSENLVNGLLARPFFVLFQSHDHIRAKPALILLSSLLSKGLLAIPEVSNKFDAKLLENVSDISGDNRRSSIIQELVKVLLEWMLYPDLAPAVGQTISALLSAEKDSLRNATSGNKIVKGKDPPTWTVPVVEAVSRRPEDLRLLRVYLFPAIFRIDLQGFWAFLQYLDVGAYIFSDATENTTVRHPDKASLESKEMLLFSALQAGKAMSLIRESNNRKHIEVHDDTIWIPDTFLGSLMCNGSSDICLAGMSLLITSAYSTRPMTIGALKTLERHLPGIFADSDPNVRSETQSLIQALVDRLRATIFNLSQKVHRNDTDRLGKENVNGNVEVPDGILYQDDRSVLSAHQSFLRWFIKFLSSELLPTASYQRHISALKSIKILARSGVDSTVPKHVLAKQANLDVAWPFDLTVFDKEVIRLLYDLLLDPFDDVRQSAVALLQMNVTKSNNDYENLTQKTLGRASNMMLDTGRLDHADGVARMYSLLCFCLSGHNLIIRNDAVSSVSGQQWRQPYFDTLADLVSLVEKGIETSKSNFSLAVSSYPMHGLFTALKYSLEQGPENITLSTEDKARIAHLIDRVCETLVQIWHTVRDVLCNDAPEGFMPNEMEGEADLTTKDVLSYSWRALKDASLLLRLIITSDLVSISATASHQDRLKVLGDLCFEQLSELRHRGAFSSVAQTFVALCQRCVYDTASTSSGLVQLWYHRILSLVKEKGSTTTRRSAGIPALMVAVLSANPSSILFEEAIVDLKNLAVLRPDLIANDELPQVHALNCLKAIFVSTKLSSRSDKHIAGVLDVAARALASTIWAIRNCGLMLFRSLADRLIGPDETMRAFSPDTSLISWDRYPGLMDTLLGLLRSLQKTLSPGSDVGAEAVFLVLDIFRRTPGPPQYREEVRTHVLEACSSSHWHVRHIAAQTFAASCRHHSAIEDIRSLLILKTRNDNMLHGHLLCVRYITDDLINSPRTNDHWHNQLHELIKVLAVAELFEKTTKGFTIAPFIDTFTLIGTQLLTDSDIGLNPPIDILLLYIRQSISLRKLFTQSHGSRQDPSLKKSIGVHTVLANMIATLQEVGNEWPTSPSSPSGEQILEVLDAQDMDTTDHIIDTIGKTLPRLSALKCLPFVEALTKFVTSSLSSPLQSVVATQNLVTILDTLGIEETRTEDSKINCLLARFDARQQFLQSASPAIAESNLRLWSHCLCARRIINESWNCENLLIETPMLIEASRCALDEWNEFNLRLAGAQALRALARILPLQPNWPGQLDFALYFAIYNALVDDDDDIRTLASEAVTKSLSFGKPVNAPAACQIVYKHLVRRHSTSVAVLNRAITKATGAEQTDTSTLLQPTAHSRLSEFLRPDNSLFAIEKQNLYLDPAKDAEMWSQVLKRLDVASAPPAVLDAFAQWVMDGLGVLSEKASTTVDGPLGWTSKPDVFTLGMRIIYASDVLLSWRRRTRKVKVRGSQIRKALAELAERGRASSLHEVWLRKIETVISRSAVLKVARVRSVLAALPVHQENA